MILVWLIFSYSPLVIIWIWKRWDTSQQIWVEFTRQIESYNPYLKNIYVILNTVQRNQLKFGLFCLILSGFQQRVPLSQKLTITINLCFSIWKLALK